MAGKGHGTELKSVVDDVEQEALDIEEAKAKANQGVDWDGLCAYTTFKVVRIKDRQLGFCYWGIVTAVVLYIVVFAFSIGGRHMQQEPGVGTVLTGLQGKAYVGDKVFDPADIRFPVIEPSGAFLLTRKVSVTQKKGTCVDYDSPKRKPCAKGEKENGDFCEVPNTWCPSLGEHNVEKPPPEAKVYNLKGIENLYLNIMAGVSFPGLSDRFFVAGQTQGVNNQFKNITVKEILNLAEPPLKLEGELLSHGALIGVSFFWMCDVQYEGCEPSVVIKKLDSGQGFVQKRARYSRQGGVETREATYLNGLRLLVDSAGLGRKASLVLAVIQLGSAIALIRVAAIVSDNIMLHSFQYSKDRREAYYRCKVQETEDFSDLQDRIHLVQSTKGREIHMRGSGGNHVELGLGPMGRGGAASSIVHGRG